MSSINGKTIWVTGASSGIGKSLVITLSSYSCNLIISSRRKDELMKVKELCESPENISILPLDLKNHEEMENLAQKAISFYGKVDILVNNAGISQRSLIKDTKLEVYEQLMDINYLGTVALSKAILPHFIANKYGHFVTVTSLMGKFGSPYRSGYCGAKHALHGFFDVMRMEHEKDGVKVTMVCPGFVQTNVAKNALTADGSPQKDDDVATQNGITPELAAKKMISAIEKDKFEVYVGGKEVKGVYLKRFFPKLLHKMVLKSQVR
ncbi:SDR family oxidoreductase [Flagellimonas lutimaris]|jgi:short-subunit dehydrogenase|uniref:SDR family oxidoreductase n=1 Tax=Flagellimonas lutimaris TaxID=475082 RepID=A0A3A1N5S2_9FLAO|nr:SDR family oxidoreductase [Allomuricauda lutimaris]RIV30613.1 SDR family oxidoreductase [Allomuricauda lutimaris]|tara:strand:- start:946 stop:1740 length:795 start_codon:yes stop_codon:yes gene_type:complete